MHLSSKDNGIIFGFFEFINQDFGSQQYITNILQQLKLIQISHKSQFGHRNIKSGQNNFKYLYIYINMSAASIIQRMLSRPIQHLVMTKKKLPNIQAIRLYRQVYKFASKFKWNNERGQPWCEIIRKSARKEFQISKSEQDPMLIMKMLVTTRECMAELDIKICNAQVSFLKTIDETKNEEQFVRKGKMIK